MYTRWMIALAVVFLGSAMLQGQTVTPIDRGLGDQRIGISLGVFTPLVNNDLEGSVYKPNQSIGGGGVIEWGFFFHPVFLAGVRVHGWFTITKTSKGLFGYDMVAKLAYVPRAWRLEFPISIGIGFSGMSFTESTRTVSKVDLALHASAGLVWNIDTRWGLGVNAAYLFIPQLYDGPVPPRDQSRLAHSLESSIMVIYNF